MPIAAPGKSILESSIKAALKKSMEDGKKNGADPDQIIANLAADLTSAIDTYVTTCIVTINPGQTVISSVIAGGLAGVGTGATVSPGTS
jgi:hypothetical protein